MKRIKQELLDEGFIVHTKTKEQMEGVIEFLETVDSIKKNTNPEFWKYYKEDTILDVNNFRDGKVYYGSKLGEKEYVYDYDDIWGHCGGVVECDVGLTFESNITISFERNGNNIMDIHGLMKSLEGYNNDVLFENGSIINIIGTDGSLLTRGRVKYAESEMVILDLLGLNGEEEEMTKIENRIEELEQSIINNKLKLEELKIANKHANVSLEISGMKLLINEEIELLKGYETLDNMGIGNVIINDETVIVMSLYGKKAVSKLSEGDSFNFLAGFFLCLTKLGSAIDTDYYDYSIHAALEDVELGNL